MNKDLKSATFFQKICDTRWLPFSHSSVDRGGSVIFFTCISSIFGDLGTLDTITDSDGTSSRNKLSNLDFLLIEIGEEVIN